MKTNLVKVTRNQLRAQLKRMPKSGVLGVHICPCKMRPHPGHPFNMAHRIMLDFEGVVVGSPDIQTLQTVVDNFTYYNCNTETGKYVHYYIEALAL